MVGVWAKVERIIKKEKVKIQKEKMQSGGVKFNSI